MREELGEVELEVGGQGGGDGPDQRDERLGQLVVAPLPQVLHRLHDQRRVLPDVLLDLVHDVRQLLHEKLRKILNCLLSSVAGSKSERKSKHW